MLFSYKHKFIFYFGGFEMACEFILQLRKQQSIRRAIARQEKRKLNQYLKNADKISYELMLDPQLLLDSFDECSKNVMWKRRVQYVNQHIIYYIMQLVEDLQKCVLNTRKYRKFQINERGKIRDISSPDILERIIQHTLYKNIIYPILTKCLIYDNGASIKGKGVKFSRDRMTKQLTDYCRKYGNKGWVVQFDFKKFFESLNHEIILDQLREKIPDERIISLCKQILDKQGECGVGLGSELSQIIAIYYPNYIDHYFKDKLRVKYYERYMDDTRIICRTYEEAVFLYNKFTELAKKLKLTINQKKSKITKLENGFTFLKTKYLVSETGKITKISGRDSATRERRRLRMFKKRMNTCVDITSKYYVDHVYIRDMYNSWRQYINTQFNAHNLLVRMDHYFYNTFGFYPIRVTKQERRERNEQRKYIMRNFELFHPSLKNNPYILYS